MANVCGYLRINWEYTKPLVFTIFGDHDQIMYIVEKKVLYSMEGNAFLVDLTFR